MKNDLMRRLAAGFTALALSVGLALPVFADDTEPLPEQKPTVHITTVDELLQLAKDCSLDTYSTNRTVLLEADLDLVGQGFAGIPIFNGTFDGQGHTISNLNLVQDGSVVGFFRYLESDAVVQDLKLEGRAMPEGSRHTVGSVVGSNAGTVKNCSFVGVSSGASKVGGIAGENLAGGTVESCTVTGSVYGAHFVGGIVGDNHGVIASCVNKAGVNTKVEQNEIDISSLTMKDLIGTENVADITDIGGVAGSSAGVVKNCQNLGTVGYQHMGYNVGGIVGSQTGYVTACTNYGTVYARKEAGGIVGQMEPNSILEYEKDTLQILGEQLEELQTLVDHACDDANAAANDTSARLNNLQSNVTNARAALERLLQTTADNVTLGTTDTTVDLSELKNSLKGESAPSESTEETPAPETSAQAPASEAPAESAAEAPAEPAPAETAPAETAPAETAPAETAPAETAPAEAPAEEPAPAESPAEEAPTSEEETRAVHGQPEPADSGEATPSQGIVDPGFSTLGDQSIWNDLGNALPDSMQVTVPTVEVTDRDAITAGKNDLSGTLNAVADTIAALNSSGSSNSQTLINDVRAITKQMNKIGNTLAGAGDNTADPDDLYSDISDTDTEQDTTGKVSYCVNQGTVDADINAGGITGAMARENDLDPEDDYHTAGSDSMNFKLKSRVVIRGCANYGEITGKKQGVGGIVGNMEMGSVLSSWNYGNVTAADATCVGGIAGTSSATIRESGAKCRLAGAKQVGGIAGSGYDIETCRAMVVIDEGTEQLGAIAGTVDDPRSGNITGNTFVDEGVAGLDGVSYADIAAPLPFDAFAAQENLPGAFKKITVHFTAEGNCVAEFALDYGGSLTPEQYPEVPQQDGSWGTWSDMDLTNLTFDAVVEAEYSDKTSVLQSEQQRDGRALLLVEGSFDSNDKLTLQPCEENPQPGTLESWLLPVQDDLAHTVRYLAPHDPDTLQLWLKTADGWQAWDAQTDGSYLKFTAPADAQAFAVTENPVSGNRLLIAGVGAAVAVVLLLLLRRRRKRKNPKKA